MRPEESLSSDPVKRRYTLADVKASYSPAKAWAEMQGDFPCYLIYRPISFLLTPPLLRLGVPVTGVTLFALVVALAMVTLAWRGGPFAYLGVAGLGGGGTSTVSLVWGSGVGDQ